MNYYTVLEQLEVKGLKNLSGKETSSKNKEELPGRRLPVEIEDSHPQGEAEWR